MLGKVFLFFEVFFSRVRIVSEDEKAYVWLRDED